MVIELEFDRASCFGDAEEKKFMEVAECLLPKHLVDLQKELGPIRSPNWPELRYPDVSSSIYTLIISTRTSNCRSISTFLVYITLLIVDMS